MSNPLDVNELLREAVEVLHDAILVTDADLSPEGPRIVYANPAVAEQTGYDIAEIVGNTPRMFQGPGTDRTELDRIRAALEAGHPVKAEVLNYAKSGREFLAELDIAPMTRDGRTEFFVSVQRDITESRARTRLLEHTRSFHWRLAELVREALDPQIDATFMHRLLEQAVNIVPGAQAGSLKLIDDQDGLVRFVSVEGYSDELLDVTFPAEFILEDFPTRTAVVKPGFTPSPGMDAATKDVLYGDVGRAGEIRASLGIPLWVGGRLRGLLNLDNFDTEEAFPESSVTMGLLFGRLVEHADQQLELSRQLRTDAVTGLPARTYGEAMLRRSLGEVGERSAGFMLLDLDDFRDINNAFGHQVGDMVIRRAGERVRTAVGSYGTVTRWTGDEFMVLIRDLTSQRPLSSVAHDVLEALEPPMTVAGHEISVSASLGVVELPKHASTPSEAIQNALIAVDHAHEMAEGAYVIYQPEMGSMVARRVRLERDLRSAIQNRDIVVHYQPRFDVESGALIAVESLARWNHPELGPIAPAEFIALAEETGLIHDLGEHVLLASCMEACGWNEQGHEIRVAVNVSVKELQRAGFPESVAKILERANLSPNLLELEITESTVMTDLRATVGILRDLRDLGVRLSIDDFGTAYSSLSRLHELPVTAIKIDRSFVASLSDGAEEDPSESALVRGIVALAKSMRLEVVAEGVETEAQLQFMRTLGCDEAQGYLLGRPIPPTELDLDATL